MKKFLVVVALIGLSLVALGSAVQHEVDIGNLDKQEMSCNIENDAIQTGIDHATGHVEIFTILQVAPQPEIVLIKPQMQVIDKINTSDELFNITLQPRFNLYDNIPPIILKMEKRTNANLT